MNELMLPASWAYGLEWVKDSPGIVTWHDDGVLRYLDISTAHGYESHNQRSKSQASWW